MQVLLGIAGVAAIAFLLARGEIFGILGPNGAGKTTSVECLQGLRHTYGVNGHPSLT